MKEFPESWRLPEQIVLLPSVGNPSVSASFPVLVTVPERRALFITEAPSQLGCTTTFCALQPVWGLESLFLVAGTAENQELQKDCEDLGCVNVRLAFGFRNL